MGHRLYAIPDRGRGYLVYDLSERYVHAIVSGDRYALTGMEGEKLERFLSMVQAHAQGETGGWEMVEVGVGAGSRVCHIDSKLFASHIAYYWLGAPAES